MLRHCWFSDAHYRMKRNEMRVNEVQQTIQQIEGVGYSTCNSENKESCEKVYIWPDRIYLGQFEQNQIKTIKL